jgi:hypothetical protein
MEGRMSTVNPRITVCCTGKGRHGRIELDTLAIDGDTITALPIRVGPGSGLPAGATVIASGELVDFALMPSKNATPEKDGWRWKCPKCGIDKRVSNQDLAAWAKALLTHGRAVADISQLPR